MFPGSLTLATATAKGLIFVIGDDSQTGILITLGAVLLLVGTLLRYKFPPKPEDNHPTPYTFRTNPSRSTGYMSSSAGAAHAESFTFATTLERQNNRSPIGYLTIQSTPPTERRAKVV